MSTHKSPCRELEQESGYSHGTIYLVSKKLGFEFSGRTRAQHEQLTAELGVMS